MKRVCVFIFFLKVKVNKYPDYKKTVWRFIVTFLLAQKSNQKRAPESDYTPDSG